MTRGDIFVIIISEVSGRPHDEISAMLEVLKGSIPGQHKFDEELSDTDAETLLNDLRKEKVGIANWLMSGYQNYLLKYSEPKGRA